MNLAQARLWVDAARQYELNSVETRLVDRADAAVIAGKWTPSIEVWNKLADLAEGY